MKSFQGLSNTLGVSSPSDCNLCVGPNHVIEAVNSQFAVYTKSGQMVVPETPFATLFQIVEPTSCACH